MMVGIDPRMALADRDVRPVLLRPRPGLSGPMLAVIAIAVAIGLFAVLEARRQSLVSESGQPRSTSDSLVASPAPLALPPEPPAQPVPVVERPVRLEDSPAVARPQPLPAQPVESPVRYAPPPIALQAAPPAGNRPSLASDAPSLIVDATIGNAQAAVAGSSKDQGQQGDNDDAVHATVIRNRASLIPQGTLLAAVLETPLNSDRPGLARAIMSREARSFDGSRVLIPKGSRLIGEFKAENNADQRRVLVTWTRLIRPDGVAIRLGSPAADALGGAGIPGRVNTHFLERFTNAVLQSALTIGVNLASQSQPGSVYVGVPGQLGAVGQSLLPNISPRTTVKVRQGAEISIFVARDLDFGGTPPVQ